ncbi:sigma-54-dependent Fis family transcriptional regulator [bacterium]|nr:sigma-54-dependent Fis family transcriptional regulator [bacterium]RQV99161.1 MAG: sigma-54-dependent Fis family transcriptional regulator [bacterium]
MPNILVVDDEKNMRRSLSIALEEWGYRTSEASSGKEALDFVTRDVYDVMLTDLVMEGMGGIELLRKVKELSPVTEVILMSAHGTISKAVKAMQLGAFNFIVKPFSMDHLQVILKNVFNQMDLKQTIKHLKAVIADHYLYDDIVTVSDSMRDVMHKVTLYADRVVPVLVQGESGVGKELVAIAIHHLGNRKDGPFVPINCGAFPDTLLDSELFGHCKGAFTGATITKRGLIEEADGGTLLLDEIGEAPPAFQVRLLRFLDNGLFRRIGEVEERKSDVRIIASTNRDLRKDIRNGKFREDLFYRLSVAEIYIPPLRERREDISDLTQRFLDNYSKRMGKPIYHLHPTVYRLFQDYSWPGNVRELENTIEHALIVTKTNEINMDDLPLKFFNMQENGNEMIGEGDLPLAEVEKKYILSVYHKTGGNKKRASEILKLSRTTLISRLKSYGIA